MKLLGRDVGGEIQRIVQRRVRRDLRIVDLSQHAFKDDEELNALKLTSREKRIARAWEQPKKFVPFVLEAAAKRIESKIRAEEAKKTEVNVENMTIMLPEKREDEKPALYIDVDTTK